MNKTVASFSSSNIGQVAFLLWKNTLPDILENKLSRNLFLYYGDYDFDRLARCYWEGDYIPACEMGECVSLVVYTIKRGKINKEFLTDRLSKISSYREWYSVDDKDIENTIGELDDTYFDIIDKLKSED